jgi:hypothetical protein
VGLLIAAITSFVISLAGRLMQMVMVRLISIVTTIVAVVAVAITKELTIEVMRVPIQVDHHRQEHRHHHHHQEEQLIPEDPKAISSMQLLKMRPKPLEHLERLAVINQTYQANDLYPLVSSRRLYTPAISIHLSDLRDLI